MPSQAMQDSDEPKPVLIFLHGGGFTDRTGKFRRARAR
jgi:carboxylesterase type B